MTTSKTITKKQMRAIHVEAMKSCVCVSSSPARDRCTVGGWIRCTGTQAASHRLERIAEESTDEAKPFPDVQSPIPCGTCGADLNEPGQWLRCRKHYVAEIERLQGLVNYFKGEAISSAERGYGLGSNDAGTGPMDKYKRMLDDREGDQS